MPKAREQILSKIQKALNEHKVSIPFPEEDINDTTVLKMNATSLEEKFVSEFSALGGKFIYCSDRTEFLTNLEKLSDTMGWTTVSVRDRELLEICSDIHLPIIVENADLDKADAGISLCESVIARTGSVLLSSAQEYGRKLPVYASVHLVLAYTYQLVWDWQDALERLQKKYKNNFPSMICLTSGPSRTADIEQTLVVGVHGPKEMYLFLIDQ